METESVYCAVRNSGLEYFGGDENLITGAAVSNVNQHG
jgi:hypothetical protein